MDDTDSDDSSEEDSLDDLNTEADSTTGDDFESILEELGDLDTEGDLATDEDSESVEDLEDTNIDLEDLELDEVSLFSQLVIILIFKCAGKTNIFLTLKSLLLLSKVVTPLKVLNL